MAEQINKNDYINHPDRIGGFNYYSLGETTIKQLQQNNLISSKTRKFQNKKPNDMRLHPHNIPRYERYSRCKTP